MIVVCQGEIKIRMCLIVTLFAGGGLTEATAKWQFLEMGVPSIMLRVEG